MRKVVAQNIINSVTNHDLLTDTTGLEIYTEQGIQQYKDDLQKSLDDEAITSEDFEKGMKDLSKLQKKTVVDKKGHQRTVYVRNQQETSKKEGSFNPNGLMQKKDITPEELAKVEKHKDQLSHINRKRFDKMMEGKQSDDSKDEKQKQSHEVDDNEKSMALRYKEIVGDDDKNELSHQDILRSIKQTHGAKYSEIEAALKKHGVNHVGNDKKPESKEGDSPKSRSKEDKKQSDEFSEEDGLKVAKEYFNKEQVKLLSSERLFSGAMRYTFQHKTKGSTFITVNKGSDGVIRITNEPSYHKDKKEKSLISSHTINKNKNGTYSLTVSVGGKKLTYNSNGKDQNMDSKDTAESVLENLKEEKDYNGIKSYYKSMSKFGGDIKETAESKEDKYQESKKQESKPKTTTDIHNTAKRQMELRDKNSKKPKSSADVPIPSPKGKLKSSGDNKSETGAKKELVSKVSELKKRLKQEKPQKAKFDKEINEEHSYMSEETLQGMIDKYNRLLKGEDSKKMDDEPSATEESQEHSKTYEKLKEDAKDGKLDMTKKELGQNIRRDHEDEEGDDLEKGGVEKTMSEFKAGTLKDSHGNKVTDRKQALAIALSK